MSRKNRVWKASLTVSSVPRATSQKAIEGLHFLEAPNRRLLVERLRETILDEAKIFFGPEEGEQAASSPYSSFTVITTFEFER